MIFKIRSLVSDMEGTILYNSASRNFVREGQNLFDFVSKLNANEVTKQPTFPSSPLGYATD